MPERPRRGGAVAVLAVTVAASAAAGCHSSRSGPQGLVLQPAGQALPTRIDPLPPGLHADLRSVSCRAATVADSQPRRYSLLVDLKGFLDEPLKTMPTRRITLGVRIHMATQTQTAYLPIEHEISYEPPRVQIKTQSVGAQNGGFGFSGSIVPFANTVSKRLLLAGRDSDVKHDPATTLTLSEKPTSCDVMVNQGYRPGQSVEISLVP